MSPAQQALFLLAAIAIVYPPICYFRGYKSGVRAERKRWNDKQQQETRAYFAKVGIRS